MFVFLFENKINLYALVHMYIFMRTIHTYIQNIKHFFENNIFWNLFFTFMTLFYSKRKFRNVKVNIFML